MFLTPFPIEISSVNGDTFFSGGEILVLYKEINVIIWLHSYENKSLRKSLKN